MSRIEEINGTKVVGYDTYIPDRDISSLEGIKEFIGAVRSRLQELDFLCESGDLITRIVYIQNYTFAESNNALHTIRTSYDNEAFDKNYLTPLTRLVESKNIPIFPGINHISKKGDIYFFVLGDNSDYTDELFDMEYKKWLSFIQRRRKDIKLSYCGNRNVPLIDADLGKKHLAICSPYILAKVERDLGLRSIGINSGLQNILDEAQQL